MLCIAAPNDVDISFTVACHRCHSFVNCSTIYDLYCIGNYNRCTLRNWWCITNQHCTHYENHHQCDAAAFCIFHILRPPENISSVLITLFHSYLTETLCGQFRASARVRGFKPIQRGQSQFRNHQFRRSRPRVSNGWLQARVGCHPWPNHLQGQASQFQDHRRI